MDNMNTIAWLAPSATKSEKQTAIRSKKSERLPSLLLVDDDNAHCCALASALERKRYKVKATHDYQSALAAAAEDPPEYAVVALKFPGGLGLCFITKLLARNARTQIVVLTDYGSIAAAREALKLGAAYYLPKPVSADDVVTALGCDRTATPAANSEQPLPLHRLEWEHILRVLTANQGNISATARGLGVDRRTLQRKLNRNRSDLPSRPE
jgi:two-component system response regulator RegA